MLHSDELTRLVKLLNVPVGHRYCVPHCVPVGQ